MLQSVEFVLKVESSSALAYCTFWVIPFIAVSLFISVVVIGFFLRSPIRFHHPAFAVSLLYP